MLESTQDDLFICDEEIVEDDAELEAALARAREDVKAGRVYTMEQARERVASWRTRFNSAKPH